MYPRTISTWITIRYSTPNTHYYRTTTVRLHYNADLPLASQSELLEQIVLEKAPVTGAFENWNIARVYDGMDPKSLRLVYTYYRPGSAIIERMYKDNIVLGKSKGVKPG